ncbi:uncharacterized protein [Drosophila suzukii]|uniref:Reverse transcriptase domain-containing protein n=1 Tax=Drosophila suzukii TaxID=28584 RepID=A0ABM4TNF5_DROSZ
MKAVLSNNVDVRALTETLLIKVKDIDETTDKADILCAVQSQFDVELPESAVAISALDEITEDARENRPAVISGDFNAWATEWDSPRTTARGKVLLESFAALDLVLLNSGTKPTFSRAGTSSIIDLTFVNAGLASGSSWEVSDTYTGSDHAAIICTINSRNGPPRVPKTVPRYKIETLDVEMVQMLFEDLSTSGSAEERANHIAEHKQEGIARTSLTVNRASIKLTSAEELLQVLKTILDDKAPGPDGIPNKVLKIAIRANTKEYVDMYNACLTEGALVETNGLSKMQYGFRKGLSTIDAVGKLCEIADKAIEGKRWLYGTKQYCKAATLDVKNAFNSASWHHTLNALSDLNVPVYIQRVIASYFEGRLLLYETDSGQSTHRVTGGVPQGSVLGPLLWNAMYDGILRITMPEGARLIGFADDVAIVVTAKKLPDAESICNEAGKRARAWLDSKGLALAAHKTEAVLISSWQKAEAATIS